MEKQASILSRSDIRSERTPPLRNALYRALRDAARVHGLSDAVTRTAEALIDFIPSAAREPVSPVQVQRLADERGCDARTIRNHIARLLALGLVADRRRDGGGRALVRDSKGAITALYGVSFAPLARDAAQLAIKAEEIAQTATVKARLRCEISVMRRNIRRLLSQLPPSELHEGFAAGPRRFAELDLPTLTRLWHTMADLRIAVEDAVAERRVEAVEHPSSFVEESDRSENSDRPLHITTDPTDPFRNRSPIKNAMKLKQGGQDGAPLLTSAAVTESGLEHVTVEMAVQAAPDDWRAEMAAAGGVGWSSFVAVAHNRCALLGVNADAWHCAVSVLGRSGAAIMVMIADANHVDRGGAVRSAGGWVRAVTRRAQAGEAQLCRSVFGLLARKGTLH
jgi:replication initiation protein RepC